MKPQSSLNQNYVSEDGRLAGGFVKTNTVLIFAGKSVHALVIAISITSEAPALPSAAQLSETRPIA